ncbi:type II secretion system F family protein [bacterium]|nr:type II secretion system F family protein [bacterium]
MPIYEYKAFTTGGATKSGVIDADTERDARTKLRKDSLIVSSIAATRGGKKVRAKSKDGSKPSRLSKFLDSRSSSQGPGSREIDIVAGMTRQLATLLGSGIALNESLSALVEQAEQKKVETLCRELREDIQQGANLADALAKHPGWFTPLYVNMVRAGQAAGNLDTVLTRLADYMQSQRALRRKIVGALTYPLMMIGIGMIVVTILMAKVVPEITRMLIEQNKELPPSTRILVGASEFLKSWWWAVFLVIGLISFMFERTYSKGENGRLVIDRTLLRIPVVGDLMQRAAVSRFTRTLSTLLQSGVPVIQSLEITQSVVGNRVVADATGHIRERVVEGTDIATPLRQSGAFPSTVGYMVVVGEQSGELEQMLDRVATAYDEEIEVAAERFTSLLEPIMIVLLAGVVGYIVFAIVQPILDIGQV